MKLKNKRALITGASQGFGLAVARAFVLEGAEVLICARGADALAQAQRELAELSEGKVSALQTDVAQPYEVRRLVEATQDQLGGLDVLVANAGVYGPKGAIQDVSWAEWEQAIAINLLGTVLLCRAVVPQFIRQRAGRIVLLSGGGATRPLPYLSAYAAAKAAVVRFGETLAEEVREFGIDVNSVAPGALNTRLLDEILAAGPEKVGADFYAQALKQKEQGGAPLERGAALCVFLASAASAGITGRLLSAIWDDWENLSAEKLKDKDTYTLRRIVPAEQ